MDERANEALSLEREFWLTGGGNPDFWEDHFAADGIVALSFGLMDKPSVVETMGSSAPWETVEMDDVRFVHSADSTVVAYRARARASGTDSEYVAVVSSVYVVRDGRLTLLFHQQTPAA